MENLIIGSIVILICLVNIAMTYEAILKIRQFNRVMNANFKTQQEWLFKQLYTMAPGKVLRPDEVEEDSHSEPAKVYNPSKDPMGEFQGKKNDWF